MQPIPGEEPLPPPSMKGVCDVLWGEISSCGALWASWPVLQELVSRGMSVVSHLEDVLRHVFLEFYGIF